MKFIPLPLPLPLPLVMPIYIQDKQKHEVHIAKEDIFDLVNKGNIVSVYFSIKQGTNVNSKNLKGQPLILYAISHNQIDIAKLLIYLGANLNSVDNEKQTTIDVIHKHNYEDTLLDESVVREFGLKFVMEAEKSDIQVDVLGNDNYCCNIM